MAKLNIQTTATPDGFRVELVGDADAWGVDVLEKEIARLADANPKSVAFDLTRLTFISSSAMGALVKLRGQLSKSGGEVFLGGAVPIIAESFRRARLEKVFKFVDAV